MTKKDINCLVIHHNDLDGKCAGAIVRYFIKDCKTYSINYGYDIPWNLIKRANKVYMVDFGLQPFSDMLKIKEMKGDNFIWIDHHMTAIKDMENSGQKFNGIQRSGEAGCELTWEWFKGENYNDSMPKMVRMLGRYDIWDLDYSPDIMPIQTGMSFYNPDADSDALWKPLIENDGEVYTKILEKGSTCLDYQTSLNEKYCKSHSFEMNWEGYNFIVANALNTNSKLFDSMFDHGKHDAVMVFGWSNGKWTFSMYTDKPGIDVGTLAKKYGGGGHLGASGFQSQSIPFDLPYKEVK